MLDVVLPLDLAPVMKLINMVQCRSPWHLIGEPSIAFGLAVQMVS